VQREITNYYRDVYKKEWNNGSSRVELIKEMIQGVFPLKDMAIEIGFMGTSNQEILIGNPKGHEKGEPDLLVKHKGKPLFNGEVTGSYVNLRNGELWLRPDKVQWARNHPNPQTWAFFVYKDKILRFCVNDAYQYPIEQRKPNGIVERFHIIPQTHAFEFGKLRRWKEQ